MNARNPFASISNYSFIRNAEHLSKQGREGRSYSSHKKYFDYQGSYLKDAHLRDWEIRKNQEEIASRLIGVQALRYVPKEEDRGMGNYGNYKTEYYNLQNYNNYEDKQVEQPLLRSKTKFKAEKCTSLKQSSMFNTPTSQRAMKSSTKDMFGSDYFNNRYATVQSEDQRQQEEKIIRKSTFHKKQSGNVSRFKVGKQPKELSQLKQQTDESHLRTSSYYRNEDQAQYQTLFLKSRGKLFYLYREPCQ